MRSDFSFTCIQEYLTYWKIVVFIHLKAKKKRQEDDHNDLLTCIFGNGENYGIHKMANSSDRSINTLRGVNDNFIRPEITGPVNDIVSD